MKLSELKEQVQKYQYMEDTKIIDISLASVIATRLKIGDPTWLIIIGASSGGKSQILRPIAETDKKFIHRLDDLTENTFLSGVAGDNNPSLLHKIGTLGIIVISDLTVIFSKNSEARQAILSQFRMIYDGEMNKHTGNAKELKPWKGYLGMIAGSTPSIYSHFEEVSDMGERFIYYRMKEIDAKKATHLALERRLFGKKLDDKLSGLYDEYIKSVIEDYISNGEEEIKISKEVKDRIIDISQFAETIRTAVHVDWKGESITKIPVPAYPMRVALQLMSIAKSMSIVNKHEFDSYDLREEDIQAIEWCGFSLANEEKRAVLKVLAKIEYEYLINTTTIANAIGLDTKITGLILQNLASVKVLERVTNDGKHTWRIIDRGHYDTIKRLNDIDKMDNIIEFDEGRDSDEKEENQSAVDKEFEDFPSSF